MTEVDTITLSGRPLIVSDVDDVILQFIRPFEGFLDSRGLTFTPRSFRLHGNITRQSDGTAVDAADIKAILHAFFEDQHQHQEPFEHVLPTLSALAKDADIVFLTAMPPQFAEVRRRHLANLGLPFPVIATEEEKGMVLAGLVGASSTPVVFVDDMAHNLSSVARHVPHCLLLSLPPPSEVHRLAPAAPETALRVKNWLEAAAEIRRHFDLTRDVEIGAEFG